jgi:hypothetical protein
MRVIVCGGRDFVDVPKLWRYLDEIAKATPIRCIIDGASDDVTGPYVGADYWAHQWALSRNIPTARFHAHWKKLGRAAGPMRNRDMAARSDASLVVAFSGGRGTKSMIETAKNAGIEVREVT